MATYVDRQTLLDDDEDDPVAEAEADDDSDRVICLLILSSTECSHVGCFMVLFLSLNGAKLLFSESELSNVGSWKMGKKSLSTRSVDFSTGSAILVQQSFGLTTVSIDCEYTYKVPTTYLWLSYDFFN